MRGTSGIGLVTVSAVGVEQVPTLFREDNGPVVFATRTQAV
jgi:hypothetical protein